jgi:hypothetical protein
VSPHLCPANGCEQLVPHNKLACPVHWARVSRPTQQRVSSTWRRRQRHPTLQCVQAHLAAMQAAIAEINSIQDGAS